MARRTGVPALLKVAQEACRLITKFTPVIIALYPTNTTLHEILETMNAACAAAVPELAAVRELGD